MDFRSGFFSVFRTFTSSPEWTAEPMTRAQAWIDLMAIANYTTGHIIVRGIKIEVPRGYVGHSVAGLAGRWKWNSRGKVDRYLADKEADGQIVQIVVWSDGSKSQKNDEKKRTANGQQNDSKNGQQEGQQNGQQKSPLTTLIYLVNYERYQAGGQQNEQPNGQQTPTQLLPKTDTKNKHNKQKTLKPLSAKGADAGTIGKKISDAGPSDDERQTSFSDISDGFETPPQKTESPLIEKRVEGSKTGEAGNQVPELWQTLGRIYDEERITLPKRRDVKPQDDVLKKMSIRFKSMYGSDVEAFRAACRTANTEKHYFDKITWAGACFAWLAATAGTDALPGMIDRGFAYLEQNPSGQATTTGKSRAERAASR